jgi:hypothetical protein
MIKSIGHNFTNLINQKFTTKVVLGIIICALSLHPNYLLLIADIWIKLF